MTSPTRPRSRQTEDRPLAAAATTTIGMSQSLLLEGETAECATLVVEGMGMGMGTSSTGGSRSSKSSKSSRSSNQREETGTARRFDTETNVVPPPTAGSRIPIQRVHHQQHQPNVAIVSGTPEEEESAVTSSSSKIRNQPNCSPSQISVAVAAKMDGGSSSHASTSGWSQRNGFPDVSWDALYNSDATTTGTTSLLGSLRLPSSLDTNDNETIPTYPRRVWCVSDAKLPKKVVSTSRRLGSCSPGSNNYKKTALVSSLTTTAAAVVAIRIAACLAVRSIVAAYDDEAAVAHCVTVDACHFSIALWRNKNNNCNISNSRSTANTVTATTPNGSGQNSGRCRAATATAALSGEGVLVECTHVRGSTITFHWTAAAILEAAEGLDSGADRRQAHQCHVTEYPRLLHLMLSQQQQVDDDDEAAEELDLTSTVRQTLPLPLKQPSSILLLNNPSPGTAPTMLAMEALGMAYMSLSKDRWDAQLHGMHSLLTLVDTTATRIPVAISAASFLFQHQPIINNNDIILSSDECSPDNTQTLIQQQQRDWIQGLILTRQLPSERKSNSNISKLNLNEEKKPRQQDPAVSCESIDFEVDKTIDTHLNAPSTIVNLEALDDQHASQMRSLALRVCTNSLLILSSHHPIWLQSLFLNKEKDGADKNNHCGIISEAFSEVLITDLQGASRPADLMTGRWSTPHDAALSAICLGILAQFSTSVKLRLSNDAALIVLLERTIAIGRSTHKVLADAAKQTYRILTEKDRSC